MSKSLVCFLSLTTLGCASAVSARTDSAPQPDGNPTTASLRAQGSEGLAYALAEFERLPEGADKEQQALLVDQVAGQRYATSSRLYWYTDIDQAKQDAARKGRPILSLRLLGRLDEEYSCANSRMFRTLLYANREVSSYLRDNFTLHWSSEREVPKITVDFGDGRVMKSTIAGNSAHYILDSAGKPVDVVPGLYGPKAFMEALEPGRRLAVALKTSKNRQLDLQAYHRASVEAESEAFNALPPNQRAALAPYRSHAQANAALLSAMAMTVSKARIEMPTARQIKAGPIGTRDPDAVQAAVSDVEALDASSRQLIAALGPTNWTAKPEPLEGPALDPLFTGVAHRVAGDTLINRHGLRPQIHQFFIDLPGQTFEQLNEVIYAQVFGTPQLDPWLGMAPEGFTGLPADGFSTR